MKTDVNKMLMDYKKDTKDICSKNRDKNILKLLELKEEKNDSNAFFEFAKGQLGLLGKYSLIWELAWLGLFIILSFYFKGLLVDGVMLPVISFISPFLLIISAVDIGKITNRSVLEIEATTKYSISQILLFRGLAYELIQLVVIFIGALICHKASGYLLIYILIYGYTPLVFSSALLLACISKFSGKAVSYAGVAIAVLVVQFLGFMSRRDSFAGIDFKLFDVNYIWVWEIVLAVSMVVYLAELVVIRKGVKVNGIGTMRSIEML